MARKEESRPELLSDFKPQLVQVSQGENFRERLEALDRLISAKQIPGASREPEFNLGLLKLDEVACSPSTGNERLLAVSRLALLGATAAPLRRNINERLRAALREPLFPITVCRMLLIGFMSPGHAPSRLRTGALNIYPIQRLPRKQVKMRESSVLGHSLSRSTI
jgi:hypothetical protein